ncbi:uncharacterized protein haspin [Corythoichthys intestinalis]|uniref:uncharacterized protein haspin n=1 Tax=Corythoichthys intestinalis TaxID=161448 RepID=UPI0025A4EF81|nr:uncharacterized protein haspin [Corythoichthys intestinalis]
MTTAKTIFLRTYGKKRREIPAWISPQEFKGAFDSSRSSDDSLFEAAIYTKLRKKGQVSVAAGVRTRREKRLSLTSSDSQEDVPNMLKSHKNPLQINTNSRANKGSCKEKVVRPTKRKAKENINYESIFNVPVPSVPEPPPRAKAVRKKAPVSVSSAVTIRHQEQNHPMIRESDEHVLSSEKCHKSPLQVNISSNLSNALLSRFVTCRQRPIITTVKVSKAKDVVLDSFDDFTSGEESHPPHRKKKAHFPVLDSSVENPRNNLNDNPLQDTLNLLADNSFGRSPRKPIFCSTPSARLSSKRPHIAEQSLNPSTLSASHIVASSCQGGKGSEKPPNSAPPLLLNSDKKQQSRCGEPNEKKCPSFNEGHSSDLFEDGKLKNDVASESEHLLHADCQKSNCSQSLVEDLPSLTEVLMEKCLAQHCTVKVKRLDSLTLSHLFYQTANSFFPSDISSAHKSPISEQHPLFTTLSSTELSNESILTATKDETGGQSSITNHLASETSDVPIIIITLSDESDCSEESRSEHTAESIQHTNGSFDLFTCAKLTAISPEQLSTRELGADCTFQGKDCKVLVKRLELEEIKASISQLSSAGQSRNGAIDTESPSVALIQKCQTDKLAVRLRRLSLTQLKELQQKPSTNISNVNNEDLTRKKLGNTWAEADSNYAKNISCNDAEKGTSNLNNLVILDKSESTKRFKFDQKTSGLVGKKRMRRSLSTDRTATTRKACVSGLSISRWKNDSKLRTPCRIKRKSQRRAGSNPISSQTIEIQEMNFSTPAKTCQLNLSSLLADLTPSTQHWNRLKSALSIHRKMLLTPPCFKTPGLKDISQLMYDADLSDADKVYTECGQQGPLPWNECISPLQMKQCVKIGEGTFGEVFSTKNSSGETIALKVIPLEGSDKVNGEDQKSFGEILHEIIISKELSSLKERHQNQTSFFIGLNNLHCVRGCYPPEFLKAWDIFDKKKGSENDRPDFFENDQLFIILEFEFGGVDLENSNGKLSSFAVAKSILHQVTAALAVAEQQLHFEHRDLHWGNILVKTTKQKTERFLLNGAVHSVESKGVLVRIIDYSLSRLEIDGLTVSCDISNDEELFIGQGDYQFDIYRNMREENSNNWNNYHPHSNVLWLHYLSSKLLSMRYRRTAVKGNKDTQKELAGFHDNILQCTSATEALQTCPIFQ